MKRQKGVRRILPCLLAVVTASFLLFTVLAPAKTNAAAGINQQMAFEGKVVLANGTNVTNGTYNLEFKIYNGGTGTGGGTLQWTEDYLVGSTGGVTVNNGTFEVNLGAITSLSSVNFNSDTLWLSLQIGNTTSCTISTTFQSNCGGDGEMTPYIRLTAVPYAFNALNLGGLGAASFGQLGTTQSWTAANTFSLTGGNAVAISGNPLAGGSGATSSLVQFGPNAIAAGNNTATTGGTYLGLNESSSGAGSTADFLNLENNSLSKLKVTSAGAVTEASTLTVSSGGIAVTGNSTIAGTLSSLTGITSSGTITLSGLSDGLVRTTGGLLSGAAKAALGTDTTGNYVLALGAGTGTTVGGTTGVGSTPTVNVTYGSATSTAVQGNVTLTCPSGTGNLSGTGNTITLGTGGTCTGLTIVNNPSFTGLITGSAAGTGLAITGAPTNTATTSLVQFGTAIVSGNTATNGGTYLGINEPASGNAGTAADFLNFQNNGTSVFKISSAGAITNVASFIASGTIQGATINGTSVLQLNGNDINASGTLNNVGYLAQSNTFTGTTNTFNGTTLNGPGGLAISSFSSGSWINLPTTGPSGIGTGGAGSNALIGYVAGAGNYFTDATTGDTAYRNSSGRLLFGSGTTASELALSSTGLTISTPTTISSTLNVGSATTDTTQVNLQLDSSSTFADNGTCSTTTNQGAMYYNTTSNAIRACINGQWEDLVSTAGLGIIAFGVVGDTGANPGDLGSKSSTTVGAGPCKVSWASTTSVTVTACSAYSGGRKVVYAGGTLTGISNTSGNWTHICFANATTPFAATSTLNALTATATETANLPQWVGGNPVECVADVKGTGTTLNVYDTRVFSNTDKTFVNTAVAMGLGWIAKDNASVNNGTVTQPGTTAGTGYLKGVVVASAGTACTSACGPNAIMAINGPVYIKSIAGTLGTTSFVENSATNDYATIGTGTTALTPYESLGIAQTPFVSTCTTAVNCNLSMLVDLAIR
jgi:hypothetical protein